MSFGELCEMFPSEESCREKLYEMRWSDGFVCVKCGSREYGYHTSKRVYQCKTKYCRYQTSLTQRYLDEFCWRFNRRQRTSTFFFDLLRTVISAPKAPYAAL